MFNMRKGRKNRFFILGMAVLGLLMASICVVSSLILIGIIFPAKNPILEKISPELSIQNGVVTSKGMNVSIGMSQAEENASPKLTRPDFVLVTATPLVQPTPTPTPVPSGPKRILVDISEQRLYGFQGSQILFTFVVSTGARDNTPTGEFQILDKIPNAYSDALGLWMPQWMGFTWVGDEEDGFHSLPVLDDGREIWGENLGKPNTTGCVVLAPQDAQTLFNWAEVGTPIVIVE